MSILLDNINILLIIVLALNIFLGFIIFNDGRNKKVNVVYDYNIVAIAMWIIGMLFYRSAPQSTSLFWSIFLYIPPTIIASSFLYFTYIFPKNEQGAESKRKVIFFINFLVILITFIPGFVIKDVNINPGFEKEIVFGAYYYLYALYTCSFFSYGFLRLFRKIKKSSGVEKQQILYLLTGYFISANLAFVTNLIMPWMGYFSLNWAGQFLTIFMVGFAAYAILKHNLFNMKVIATEIITFALLLSFLVRFILSENQKDFIINGLFLLVAIIFGYFLIKSVQKEVYGKEEIQKLALGLEQANEQLKAIDERKSDFINIASHQLRTPTTAIKGYTALLLDGAYGSVPEKEKEIIQRMNGLADQNVKIIADMLNISRIEQNRMKYTFEKVEIAQFILDIIHTLKIKAEGKKLPLNYTFDKTLNDSLSASAQGSGETSEAKKVYANVDKTLLAQVFENVIDNSVKYTQKGSVDIDIRLDGKKLIFKCKDTGIGIDKESLATLFKKFGRAKNAQESGIEGTGIGLYIAKDIMEKHHGDITITSEGEGKGSESTITMEIDSAESHVATVN